MMVTLPPDYRPTDAEEFMNPIQVEYFRQKLLRWRHDLLREADGTLASLSDGGIARGRHHRPRQRRRPTGRWNCAPATAPAS